MSLNSLLVCATSQTRLRTRYATGHDAVAIPPRLLKEQGFNRAATTPETLDENEEPTISVGMLAALPEVRLDLDEEERASFDENTAMALERHETPPEERDVDGDNVLP